MGIGRIVSLNISKEKGTPKKPVKEVLIKKGFGIIGDAHAGTKNREISLLGVENINRFRKKFPGLTIKYGEFAENITTQGIDLNKLRIGKILELADQVKIRITQIGKECHTGCVIKKKVGACIMPKEGIFAEVLNSGKIRINDKIKV